jgi:hypothetical protein
MDRVGPFRPAIELEPLRFEAPRRPARPGPGPAAYAATGVLAVIIAGQLLLAWSLEPIARWTAERPDEVELRSLSALALTDTWRWSVPAVTGALLLAMLGLLRVRRAAPYLALAVVASAVAILTFVWATAPF